MASNIKVDIVKPTATNGSLSLKGDSGGSATANGITVDSSGNTTITGNFTSKGIDDNASSTALTIDASGNVQLANSLTAGTLGSGVTFPAGHVLQTICQTGFTETSDTSGTGTTTTLYCGWTASITLSSASNKILLMLNLPFQVTRSGAQAYLQDVYLYHQKGTLSTSGSGGTLSLTGASNFTIADLYPYRLGSGGTLDGVITHQRLVTTDNVNNHFTFSAVINSDMSSGYFNRQFGDGAPYSITLMEIAQ